MAHKAWIEINGHLLLIIDLMKEQRRKQILAHTGDPRALQGRGKKWKKNVDTKLAEEKFATHKKTNGAFVNDEAREISEKIQAYESTTPSQSKEISSSDSLAHVLGSQEHNERVRGLGLGPYPSKVFGIHARSHSGSSSSTPSNAELQSQRTPGSIGSFSVTPGITDDFATTPGSTSGSDGIPEISDSFVESPTISSSFTKYHGYSLSDARVPIGYCSRRKNTFQELKLLLETVRDISFNMLKAKLTTGVPLTTTSWSKVNKA
ncbi:hypothetical protein V8G54_019998 [Vigna mungo]|uniref:Uncharacterized protein n=1 Tax=Vigna mungo TaxID=3915 RepID=A0AAQ3NCT6_VIGMU